MDQRTREHLDTAERNRSLALSLLAPPITAQLPVAPSGWVAVIAFYAAVHYVNAYLWEQHRVEPRDHAERSRYVRSDPVLRRCRVAYDRLRDEGYKARYVRGYQIGLTRAQGLVSNDLEGVAAVVMSVL